MNVIGKVMDKQTNKPLPFITVFLGDNSTSTDMNGGFAFKNIPQGSYLLKVRSMAYKPFEQMISSDYNGIIEIHSSIYS